jgi:hypothetical protein
MRLTCQHLPTSLRTKKEFQSQSKKTRDEEEDLGEPWKGIDILGREFSYQFFERERVG